MPKGPISWSGGCRGKVAYPSRGKAAAALRVMLKSPTTRTPDLLHAYRCTGCGAWHLGNAARVYKQAVLRVRAAVSDVVEIEWLGKDGRTQVERRTWSARGGVDEQ